MISREFNLYLHAGHSIPLVINVNQYDQGEQWLFTLFNADGTQYVPSSGAIVGIKSDNLGIINSGTVDSQGRVVINETQQMTAAVGKAVFELVIDDGTHGTANFVVLVEPKPGDNADMSETDISMIEQAIEAASTIKPYGSPLVASTVAGMTDHEKVYVYVGSETGYTSGNWYYWDGSAWTSGGVYNSVAVQTDTTLTLSGVAADAKKTGDEISDLKSEMSQNSGLTNDQKQALMDVIEHIGAWTDGNGRTYVANARTALFPPANLTRITAVYTQGGTVYDTDSLDSLKADLVVTAYYSDDTSSVVSAYTLSGTLTEGTSTITVAYGGKSATFDVIVTHYEQWDINWSYTDGLPENNGFTLLSNNASTKTLREDGLLLANTGSTGNISYGITNEPVPCERLIFESVFSPQTLATLPSTPKGVGYYVLFVNNGKGINIAVNSGGLGYYEGKDTATKGWHFADVSIATETEYTVRLEVDDTTDTATLYLDGSLITTFGIASTASAQTKIYQLNGGSTLHKSMKLRYEQ